MTNSTGDKHSDNRWCRAWASSYRDGFFFLGRGRTRLAYFAAKAAVGLGWGLEEVWDVDWDIDDGGGVVVGGGDFFC